MTTSNPTPIQIRRAIKQYNDQVKAADEDVKKQLDHMVIHAQFAAWISVVIHLVVFCFADYVLVHSLWALFIINDWDVKAKINLWVCIISLSVIVIILFRNPVRLIRQSLTSNVAINFVYLHFIRQIYQADTEFMQMVQNQSEHDKESLDDMAGRMQIVLEEAVDQIKNLLDELE